MIAVETLQPENRVLTSILQTLAREGLVTVEGFEDEEEMSETTLHFAMVNYFYNALKLFLKERQNCFVAGNLRISYDPEQPLKWYAPDVFVAFGVENRERRSFNLASEKIMPQVVFEVASDTTYDADLGKKYADYAMLGVEEYYLLDPERNYLPTPLIAYQRENGILNPVKIENKRIFSPLLGLEIVDTGDNFRLFNPNTNEFLRSTEELVESEIKLRQRIAELEARLNLNGKS